MLLTPVSYALRCDFGCFELCLNGITVSFQRKNLNISETSNFISDFEFSTFLDCDLVPSIRYFCLLLIEMTCRTGINSLFLELELLHYLFTRLKSELAFKISLIHSEVLINYSSVASLT